MTGMRLAVGVVRLADDFEKPWWCFERESVSIRHANLVSEPIRILTAWLFGCIEPRRPNEDWQQAARSRLHCQILAVLFVGCCVFQANADCFGARSIAGN